MAAVMLSNNAITLTGIVFFCALQNCVELNFVPAGFTWRNVMTEAIPIKMTTNADEKLNDIMWKGQQIEALLRGIQALLKDGINPDADAMDTLAGIAEPMINEIRDLADGLGGELRRRPTVIKGGAK